VQYPSFQHDPLTPDRNRGLLDLDYGRAVAFSAEKNRIERNDDLEFLDKQIIAAFRRAYAIDRYVTAE